MVGGVSGVSWPQVKQGAATTNNPNGRRKDRENARETKLLCRRIGSTSEVRLHPAQVLDSLYPYGVVQLAYSILTVVA